LGNVRAVVSKDNNGNAAALVSATDYYPFGMPMPNRQIVNGEPYRYAYQGQEKDPETGKKAFQLRLWDSRIGRWLTTDPKGQYNSPYLGMGNNPIIMEDPDGGAANPVYGSDGEYRGDTVEGFTGEAIIYDGKADFTNLTKDQLTSEKFGGTFLSNFSFASQSIRDGIESHIVNYNLKDGLNIDGNIKIQYSGKEHVYNASLATKDNLIIQRGKHNDNYFEPTVENLRNIVNLHEVKGHVLGGLGGSAGDHILIYKSQINHKQFHSTTRRFKQSIGLNFYSSGGNFNDGSKLTNFYYRFGKKIIDRYNVWQKGYSEPYSSDYFSIFK
jgi:RHS repeat-associated protein